MVDGRKQPSSDARDTRSTTLPTAADDSVYGDVLSGGTVIGRFVVEGHVADGGYARVYRAREATTGQPVAIKVLHQFLAARGDVLRRFDREIRTVRRLQHRNIVAMLDAGHLADGRPYLAMEWLDGPTLLEELRRVGPLPVARAFAIAEELAAGLEAAHAAGIVHRDLKASNVILAGSPPVAKLLDFGVAKLIDAGTRLTVSGIKVGTPASMAPEQIAGGPISPATDVYALAVLVFRMLVGRYPFEAANAVEMQDRHLRAAPAVPGSFDPTLRPFDAVLLRALEKDPARRHPSVGALVADLRAVAAHPGGSRLRSETVPGVGLRVLGPAPSVRAACEAAGLAVCVDTAEVLVAVAAVPPGEAGRELRARVLDLALAVGGEAMVHAAPVVRLMVDERTQYAGGPLLALEEWTPVAGGGAVATAAAVEGLEDRYALEGSQIYRVLGRRE